MSGAAQGSLGAQPAGFAGATCVAVKVETPTIRTFVLKPDDAGFLSFSPGQSTTLCLDLETASVSSRTFSIASAPVLAGQPLVLELTVKAHAVWARHAVDA